MTVTDLHEGGDAVSNFNLSNASGERGVDVGRVGAWATDFAKLLADPVGLQTFTEFLKKEFSAENILFWVSCEKYRRLTDNAARHAAAITILDRHLSVGAPDPVNVDSHARQAAQDGMAHTDDNPDLFAVAQKQIYNLMKFDSYSRFLKSDLYKDALLADMAGKPLPFADKLNEDLDLVSAINKTDARRKDEQHNSRNHSVPGADTENNSSRRRSILPWNNLKGKDR